MKIVYFRQDGTSHVQRQTSTLDSADLSRLGVLNRRYCLEYTATLKPLQMADDKHRPYGTKNNADKKTVLSFFGCYEKRMKFH